MNISSLHVAGYRSIRELEMPLQQVNVIVGANGCGKSNLYRSLYLLAMAAQGTFARSVAEEGGMPSVLWAGERKNGPVIMSIGVSFESLEYQLMCGLHHSSEGPFFMDPRVKQEMVWFTEGNSKLVLLERGTTIAKIRDSKGNRVEYPMTFSETESVLSQLREPHRFPHLLSLYIEMKNWRFYHHFRTDSSAPMRQPQVGVSTPILNHNGDDLAAALSTIDQVDEYDIQGFFDAAFPGARLSLFANEGRFSFGLKMPGVKRTLDARELSDGTIRYICLRPLSSPRPPSLLAINEPEASLHPELLEPLAKLIGQASKRSQLWITTHSYALAEYIESYCGIAPIRLVKVAGETRLA